MKLAVALTERADLQERIHQLENRLRNNALVQEEEEPAEDPEELLQELENCYSRLEELVADINRTNCWTDVHGDTLTGLLTRRDCLKSWIHDLQDFRDAASSAAFRGAGNGMHLRSTVNVRNLQEQIDQMSSELRELDISIQEWNWNTELLESGQKKK